MVNARSTKYTGAKTCSKFQTRCFFQNGEIFVVLFLSFSAEKISKFRLTSVLLSSKCHPADQDILLKSNADIQDMSNGDKVAFLNTEWEDAHLYSFPER